MSQGGGSFKVWRGHEGRTSAYPHYCWDWERIDALIAFWIYVRTYSHSHSNLLGEGGREGGMEGGTALGEYSPPPPFLYDPIICVGPGCFCELKGVIRDK